jgi:drug/metabolite transporter (DMT)-like permease
MGYEYLTPSEFDYIDSSTGTKSLISGLLLLCQVIWAYALVLTKEIKSQNAYQIGFHFGLVQTIMGAAVGLGVGLPSMDLTQSLLMFVKVSMPLGIANVLLTLSLTMTKKTGNLTMVMFNNVVTGYLISVFRYGERLNWLAIMGSCGIFFGLFFVLIR